MIYDDVYSKGCVEIIIERLNGEKNAINVNNAILLSGRRALANCLARNIGDSFQFYISRMIFGDGGTIDGVKKYVNSNRDGLFGVTRLSKPVIANIDNSVPAQVIFTSVIKFDEVVGVTLNEMALQMANGDLYSMTTFPDLNKTEDIQLTLNWSINMI